VDERIRASDTLIDQPAQQFLSYKKKVKFKIWTSFSLFSTFKTRAAVNNDDAEQLSAPVGIDQYLLHNRRAKK